MVFLVFFSHQTMLGIDKDVMFVIGRIGVAGFFLMSGYLAVNSLERRNMKQYALNRFLRLYPVFWLLVTLSFLLRWPKFSIDTWLANLTLFHEFLGKDCILGASWMLPIMVIFFFILVFSKRYVTSIINGFWALCVGALVLGTLRMWTGKPFPTALFLLQIVGLLGYFYKTTLLSTSKTLLYQLVVFEITLVVASYLSYENKVVFYFIAYNTGLIFFFIFKRYNIHFKCLDQLGALGFTFFLGAGIPILLLAKITDMNSVDPYLLVTIKFILAIVLSWIVTNYIENPLLAKGKEWEKRLK